MAAFFLGVVRMESIIWQIIWLIIHVAVSRYLRRHKAAYTDIRTVRRLIRFLEFLCDAVI